MDWEALREVEETNKGDAGEKQPVFLEGAIRNMEFNIYVKRYFHQQPWQCYHKFSSGRDKHEVLEEMTSHLGDSSTKPTDKGQVGDT